MNVRRVAGTLVTVALLLMPVGCAQDPAPEADPEAPQTSEPDTGSAEPDPETQDPNGGTPSVSLPGLPIGGDTVLSDADPSVSCTEVTWIADEPAEVPDGIEVVIDAVTLSQAYFGLADGGCESFGTACVGYTFTAADNDAICVVAVTLVGDVPDDHGDESLSVAGSATCDTQELCDELAADVADETQFSIDLDSSLLDDGTGEGETDETPTE